VMGDKNHELHFSIKKLFTVTVAGAAATRCFQRAGQRRQRVADLAREAPSHSSVSAVAAGLMATDSEPSAIPRSMASCRWPITRAVPFPAHGARFPQIAHLGGKLHRRAGVMAFAAAVVADGLSVIAQQLVAGIAVLIGNNACISAS
nr:hypothetical protein [Serratia marcescens]